MLLLIRAIAARRRGVLIIYIYIYIYICIHTSQLASLLLNTPLQSNQGITVVPNATCYSYEAVPGSLGMYMPHT